MATAGIPFFPNHWYYNTESGQLTTGNNLENLGNNLLGGVGWHELNIPGSATEAQAATEAVKEFPTGKTPTAQGLAQAVPKAVASGVGSAAKDIAGAAAAAIAGAIKATFQITGFSGTNFALRAIKVVAG